MSGGDKVRELVSLLGTEAATPLIVEALESDSPAEVLAAYLAEAWSLYIGGGSLD